MAMFINTIRHCYRSMLELGQISNRRFLLFKKIFGLLLALIFVILALSFQNLFFGAEWPRAFCFFASILSLIFGFSNLDRITGPLLFLMLTGLQIINPTILRVIPGFLGFYLIYVTFFSMLKHSQQRQRELNLIFSLVISFSIFYSGFSKVVDVHWLSGNAMATLSTNPRMDEWMGLIENKLVLKIINYMVIGMELLYFPLFWNRRTRKYASYSGVVLFISMFFLMKIKFILGTICLFLIMIDDQLIKRIN